MRFVYLDESGRGNPSREPYFVVAGVIVNADKQLQRVEHELEALVEKYVPADKREGFCFHAKELANGGGVFDRVAYPEKKRLNALEDLCKIPKKFKLPIVVHGMDRGRMINDSHGTLSMATITTLCHASSAMVCLLAVEKYMRENAGKCEVATLVHENTDEAKRHIRDVHNALRKAKDRVLANVPDWDRYTPIKRIAETAFFAEKNESSLLQVADAVAFMTNRMLRRVPGTERFASHFAEQLRL